MNPRVSRSLGAREQGHRLPDRQDRGQARGGLHPRRDRQRHHARHARRASSPDRLRRGEGPALGVREVPAATDTAHHAHEVRGGGHGDRPHVPRGVHQGACARSRTVAEAGADGKDSFDERTFDGILRCPTSTGSSTWPRRCAAGAPSRRSADDHAASIPGSSSRLANMVEAETRARRQRALDDASPNPPRCRSQAPRPLRRAARASYRRDRGSRCARAGRARRAPDLQVGRHLRGRVRGLDALLLHDLRGGGRGRPPPEARA